MSTASASVPAVEGPVARVAGVSHRYRKVRALDDVTLEIPAGRQVGLGPAARPAPAVNALGQRLLFR